MSSVVLTACTIHAAFAQQPVSWPQFRGVNAAGIAAADADPPATLSLEEDVLWKKPVTRGQGSPCIWGERLLLTGFEPQSRSLQVLCFDRRTGESMWQHNITAEQIEKVHSLSSPATATVATDGEFAYIYFGSVGLICLSLDGQPIWEHRLAVPQMPFGSGTSPIVAGDLVLLNRDAPNDAFLLAVDRRTGTERWKRPLESASLLGTSSYATPVIWNDQIILHRTGEIAAYQQEDGERSWWFRIATTGNSTPVIGNDALFVSAWNNFGEPELRVDLPSFNQLLKEHDTDGDKRLSKEEFPDKLAMAKRPEVADDVPGAQVYLKYFFDQLDANNDQQITGFEWLATRVMLTTLTHDHGLVAIGTGGQQDISKSHLLWTDQRGVPEIPSPLFFENRVYQVKDGGIVSCHDALSGKLIYRERVGAPGAYYSSPIAAARRIYLASANGVMTVLAAGDTPQVIAKCDFREPILATPAAVERTLYVRTNEHLYALQKP